MKALLLLLIFVGLILNHCNNERISSNEGIGYVTTFSQTGIIWKSWDGELKLSQTGMTNPIERSMYHEDTTLYYFSIDNEREDPVLIKTIDSAASFGWKVKLCFHEGGHNYLRNRGGTSHFVSSVEVIDRPSVNIFRKHAFPDEGDNIYALIFIFSVLMVMLIMMIYGT
jgi:hypothetical protein